MDALLFQQKQQNRISTSRSFFHLFKFHIIIEKGQNNENNDNFYARA